MGKTIFYSWQSDLPKKKNRTLIEKAIKGSVAELQELDLSVEFSIDKDTKDTIGTPDIVDTILRKISRASLFVADVSIVTSPESKRAIPNPNVMIELGYAAKALGWERIVCVYNKDYGDYDKLPFNIRNRRPLAYSPEESSCENSRRHIQMAITSNLKGLRQSGLLEDDVLNHLKLQVDRQVLDLVNGLGKLIYGYSKNNDIQTVFPRLLSLQQDEIETLVLEREFLGFQILKSYRRTRLDLERIVDKILASKYFDDEVAKVVIRILRWVDEFGANTRHRSDPHLFKSSDIETTAYTVVSGHEMNPRNDDDGYILLRKESNTSGIVIDSGDFSGKPIVDRLLYGYKIDPDRVEQYAKLLGRFIALMKEWLELTDGSLILDTNNHILLKKKQ